MTRRLPAPLPWLAGLLAIYLVAPLIAGVQQAGFADWRAIDIAALARACAISIGSATVATLVIALGGIPLGYLLARRPGRVMALLGFLVQLPLALPPLTSGILLLFLVGYGGPLGRLTGGVLTDSFAGIVLSEIFVASPFLIIAARSAFAAMDSGLEGVAATLGRGPCETFFRVSLPIAGPAIAAGLLLAWLRAFGEFGATVMVAYHPYSLPVYTYVAFGAQGLPAMLPILLPTLVIALGVMALISAAAGRRNRQVTRPAVTDSLPMAASGGPAKTAPAAARGVALTLQLEKRLNGFLLDIAWAPRARRLAILGPSGSGKSLTLKLITGIERCDRGHIILDGTDLSRCDPAMRPIAYVPQNYGLFPHLSVSEQLRFPAGANSQQAKHWVDRLGLQGLEDRRPAALSLGQQQRVALARALVKPADLLLLDEPFSALDAPLRARLRRELLGLQEELSAATVLVTHDPWEAALLADELLVLEGGRALQAGPTSDVFRRPASETVARLLGCETVAHGVVADHDKIAIGRDVFITVAGPALRPGERVGWSFAPTHARIGANGAYQGSVEHVTPMGIAPQVTIRVGDATVRIVGEYPGLAEGDPCRFDLDPGSLQVWPRR
ncbi:MAG: ATP-binding cassette domain-containing protein [Alphaproteobacteria bacterium]|nr:ATP-binding cassette domain-containing protein [Alphaproteobacteria bacterium]